VESLLGALCCAPGQQGEKKRKGFARRGRPGFDLLDAVGEAEPVELGEDVVEELDQRPRGDREAQLREAWGGGGGGGAEV